MSKLGRAKIGSEGIHNKYPCLCSETWHSWSVRIGEICDLLFVCQVPRGKTKRLQGSEKCSTTKLRSHGLTLSPFIFRNLQEALLQSFCVSFQGWHSTFMRKSRFSLVEGGAVSNLKCKRHWSSKGSASNVHMTYVYIRIHAMHLFCIH